MILVAGGSVTIPLISGPAGVSRSPLETPTLALQVPNLPSSEEFAIFGLLLLGLIIAILWALRPRQYYCRNRGQDLGRGDPPDRCPKCNSNRFTHEDPGVGEKLRIEQVD